MNLYTLAVKKTSPKLSLFVDGHSKSDDIGICQMYFDDGSQASITRDGNGKVCAVLAQNFNLHRRKNQNQLSEVKS